jgi:DNA-binding transcriptional LysR family regulator
MAIAEEQSFTRAAKKLNISQPPLTRQIKDLEAELGVDLFDRSQRKIALTSAGRAFMSKARNALYESKSAIDEARRLADGFSDVLTIGFMSSIMLGEFVPFLSEFYQLYPSVALKFKQLKSDEQLEALIDDRIDVGFVDIGVRSILERLKSEKIVSNLFMHETLCLAAPRGHPLTQREYVQLADLKSENFAILERHLYPAHYDKVIATCKKGGFVPHITHFGDQIPTVLAYVAAGMAICITPECAANSWNKYISFIPLEKPAYVDIYMINKNKPQAVSLGRLRDLVIKHSQKRLTSRDQ